MMERTGRPGYDTAGTAVIMTDKASQSKYKILSGGIEIVESHLLSKLVETLNSEIFQCVICDDGRAIAWVKSIFFTRVQKNPNFYGM